MPRIALFTTILLLLFSSLAFPVLASEPNTPLTPSKQINQMNKTSVILAKDQTVRVRSGPAAIDNPPSDLFWSTAFLWNNNGDAAQLIDDKGSVRDSYCYEDGC